MDVNRDVNGILISNSLNFVGKHIWVEKIGWPENSDLLQGWSRLCVVATSNWTKRSRCCVHAQCHAEDWPNAKLTDLEMTCPQAFPPFVWWVSVDLPVGKLWSTLAMWQCVRWVWDIRTSRRNLSTTNSWFPMSWELVVVLGDRTMRYVVTVDTSIFEWLKIQLVVDTTIARWISMANNNWAC